MADIAAGDVVYTIGDWKTLSPVLRKPPGQSARLRVKVVFGNGVLTYPVGGVPLTLASLGTKNVAESVQVVAAEPVAGDTNPVWKWNGSQSAPKLVAYSADANTDTDDLLLSEAANAITVSAQTLYLDVIGW